MNNVFGKVFLNLVVAINIAYFTASYFLRQYFHDLPVLIGLHTLAYRIRLLYQSGAALYMNPGAEVFACAAAAGIFSFALGLQIFVYKKRNRYTKFAHTSGNNLNFGVDGGDGKEQDVAKVDSGYAHLPLPINMQEVAAKWSGKIVDFNVVGWSENLLKVIGAPEIVSVAADKLLIVVNSIDTLGQLDYLDGNSFFVTGPQVSFYIFALNNTDLRRQHSAGVLFLEIITGRLWQCVSRR